MSNRITLPPPAAHPKIHALYQYWLRIAPRAGMLPSRRAIDPIEIPALLDNIWLVDVVGEPPRFRFRLIGDAPRRMGIPGKPGDFLDQFHAGGPNDAALDDFRFVAAQRLPVWFLGKALVQHQSQMFELERLFLPLASDGTTVDIILCLTVFYTSDGKDI
jgi:hypothetical protein